MKTSNITKAVSQKLIDRKRLATRWGCSVVTIKRREKEGFLKPVDLMGRIVRYRLTDIEDIENGKEVT